MANFIARLRQKALQESTYNKLVEHVKEDNTRRYRLDDGLLYYVGRKLYVPSIKLRWELLKETHNTKWVGYLEKERTFPLISESFH